MTASKLAKLRANELPGVGAPDVLRLEEAESPRLERHKVRIWVHTAGVNFAADSLMVGGTYQVKPPFPFTPGLEAAGGSEGR
jgi:NADPH2:quinone reductase